MADTNHEFFLSQKTNGFRFVCVIYREFMTGDKKLKKISRLVKPTKEKKKKKAIKDDSYSKYSRTFKKTEIDPVTLSVKVTKPTERLKSVPGNPASLPRLEEDEG